MSAYEEKTLIGSFLYLTNGRGRHTKVTMAHIDMKRQRGDCFKLLAACFYEPEKEFFQQEGLCENIAALCGACGFEKSEAAAEKMSIGLEKKSSEEMNIDYARLFVGPFELTAPPYGSVYMENNRRLMGDSTLAVQKMYNEAGLSLEVKEAPDHIALELEFLHFLCLCETDAAAEDNIDAVHRYSLAQSKFIGKFMAPWVSDFCEKIRKGTDNDFYLHLADCLESFIGEMNTIYEIAGSLRNPEDSHVCQAST